VVCDETPASQTHPGDRHARTVHVIPTKKETRKRYVAGALAGLLAGASGVATAEALTALLTGVTSPLLAVANRAIDETPRPLKEFAIETFGDADKLVLIASVIATVAGLAVAAGVIGVVVAVLIVTNPTLQQLVAQGAIELPPFPLEAALIGLGAATVVGALAGLLPALVAVRVKVIDAIRY